MTVEPPADPSHRPTDGETPREPVRLAPALLIGAWAALVTAGFAYSLGRAMTWW